MTGFHGMSFFLSVLGLQHCACMTDRELCALHLWVMQGLTESLFQIITLCLEVPRAFGGAELAAVLDTNVLIPAGIGE